MKANDSPRKYAAFISYRHVSPDKEIARILQFLLEYNLVRPGNSSMPRHIRPVFLDVSELPTEENLEEGILQALDNSDCLYVICSPDLPKSKYCLQEIAYFKEKNGGRLNRVATLLVRGEPQESFPASLRTKRIPDPENPQQTVEVEIEPLYADVRAKSLPGSVWKLFRSEYLRLACLYYRCSYDELKKRHKRNLIAFLAAAIVGIMGISGILAFKDYQVRQTVADSCAAYAKEQTHANNELLALALCTNTEYLDTDAYSAALRSAVVQLDYKQHNQPIAKTLETKYFHGAFSNYYLSSTENKLVISDDHVWQIIDAHNGAVLLQLPCEAAYVLGDKPENYVMLKSHPDEQGIFRDYIVYMDLETNQVILEHPFRESGEKDPDYKIIRDLETKELYLLTDHGEPAAYFTSQGRVMTLEEFVQAGMERVNILTPKAEDPYRVVRDKQLKSYAVKDPQGNLLLVIGDDYQAAALSGDNRLFACAVNGVLTVYDTQTWEAVNSVPLESTELQNLHLLSGSSYYIAGYRQGSATLSYIGSWRTGEIFFTTEAAIMTASGENAFYTIQDGTICRYQYTDLDADSQSRVIAHNGNRCLSGTYGHYLLRDTSADRVLLQTDARKIYADEALQTLLQQFPERLVCCDGSGGVKWELSVKSSCAAMAPDGSCIAWLDSRGDVSAHSTSDGELIRSIPGNTLMAVGNVQQLVCNDRGVGILGKTGALWVPNGETPVPLGAFTEGTLFSDGMLLLENSSRVNDFRLYDTEKGSLYPPFSDNTGIWAYSPATGYLVRHVESTGNNPSLYLEIRQKKNAELVRCGRVELTDNRVDALSVDSSGQYLCVVSDGCSRILRLKDQSALLDVAGQLYYEAEKLYGLTLYGRYQYQIPMYSTTLLRQLAKEALTSPVSVRTLTDEEARQYAVSQ